MFLLGIMMSLSIYFGKVGVKYKYSFLTLLIAGIYVSAFFYELNLKDFGFVVPTVDSVSRYGLVLLLGIILTKLFKTKDKLNFKVVLNKGIFHNPIAYVLISSPMQEIMSRGYILAVFRYFEWNNIFLYSLLSAMIFSFSHIFLRNIIMMKYTFVLGFVLALIYFNSPDIISASICHGILGIINTNLVSKKKTLGTEYTGF